MSTDGEGSKENNSQIQQQTTTQHTSPAQQQQSIIHQELNFSINDIFNNNHDVNDSSFQSIVQTLSNNNNEEHITPSYAHLPAELQDLFNTNETDDLLSVQGNHTDASLLQGDIATIWNNRSNLSTSQPFIQPNSNPIASSSSLISSSVTNSPITTPSIQATPVLQPSSHPVTPAIQVQTPSLQPTPIMQPPPQQQTNSPTTLLDNIVAQLPLDRKEKFIQIFRQLQTSSITAAQFLTQAKSLLGQQQYQQLEDLKNKPAPIVQKPATDDEHRKRPIGNLQNNTEGTQQSIPGVITPQLKKIKTEHIPPVSSSQTPYIQTAQQPPVLSQPISQQSQPPLPLTQIPTTSPVVQPSTQPVFKAPATPSIAGLQVPSKANVPPSSSKPSILNGPTTATATATAAAAATTAATTTAATTTTPAATMTPANTGGDRIDYDTLTDVMGYAGVDLKEEAEHFIKDGDSSGILPDGIDRSKAQDFMNTDMLREKILKYAKSVNIKEIDNDFVSYIALATQDRLRRILEAMVAVSKHRTFDPFGPPPLSEDGHPLFKIQVKQNVQLQLETICKVSKKQDKIMDQDKKEEEEEEEEVVFNKGWYSNKSKTPLKSIDKERKVTIQDAIFVMERDVQGGRGTNQRTLLKSYNGWLY
ncbi:transcription initiation factor TFIID component TAF4 family-domain-containing protein [Cokeromyces recurvatus]|uniref:transcription initiation factor TFIID component TAF4 family-domain-containing protein n=1 Tax=Cokeromyces recurvatus TaxID=90255 RepID=UPI0022212825|nr:transcription initiation factor TFIID component TAF4 family-domain-containing protein [Cokeromyces recurvatus]KAI7907815.1 transcription initiation factor TFIID component TAF4 family-domain-containing protein [Cokeromyces recurvatus]